MKPFFEILTWVTFAVAMIVAPVAWFRGLRAKTRAAYWKNNALFVVPIALVFLFAYAAGLIPETPTPPPIAPSSQDVFSLMPTNQKFLLIAAAILWIGGGNLLSYYHNRRLGKKGWQLMNLLDPPFKDFNRNEWLILGTLVVCSMALGAVAISYSHA